MAIVCPRSASLRREARRWEVPAGTHSDSAGIQTQRARDVELRMYGSSVVSKRAQVTNESAADPLELPHCVPNAL